MRLLRLFSYRDTYRGSTRRFERELEALRKELAEANARAPLSSQESPESSPELAVNEPSTPISPLLEPTIGAAVPDWDEYKLGSREVPS